MTTVSTEALLALTATTPTKAFDGAPPRRGDFDGDGEGGVGGAGQVGTDDDDGNDDNDDDDGREEGYTPDLPPPEGAGGVAVDTADAEDKAKGEGEAGGKPSPSSSSSSRPSSSVWRACYNCGRGTRTIHRCS